MSGNTSQIMKESDLIMCIVKRAQKMRIAIGDPLTQFLDIENAHKQFKLRLEEMTNGDDINFGHDFCGIQQHMNRRTGRIEDLFVPRYATVEEVANENR